MEPTTIAALHDIVLEPSVPFPLDSLCPITQSLREINLLKQHNDCTISWLATCMAQLTVGPTAEPHHFHVALGIPHLAQSYGDRVLCLDKNVTWQLTPLVLVLMLLIQSGY
jgi:hypothetical protein